MKKRLSISLFFIAFAPKSYCPVAKAAPRKNKKSWSPIQNSHSQSKNVPSSAPTYGVSDVINMHAAMAAQLEIHRKKMEEFFKDFHNNTQEDNTQLGFYDNSFENELKKNRERNKNIRVNNQQQVDVDDHEEEIDDYEGDVDDYEDIPEESKVQKKNSKKAPVKRRTKIINQKRAPVKKNVTKGKKSASKTSPKVSPKKTLSRSLSKNVSQKGAMVNNAVKVDLSQYDFIDDFITNDSVINDYESLFFKDTGKHFKSVILNTKNYLSQNNIMPDKVDDCKKIFLLQLTFELFKDSLINDGMDMREFDISSINNLTFDNVLDMSDNSSFYFSLVLQNKNINNFNWDSINFNAFIGVLLLLLRHEEMRYYYRHVIDGDAKKLKELFIFLMKKNTLNLILFPNDNVMESWYDSDFDLAYREVLVKMFMQSSYAQINKMNFILNFNLYKALQNKALYDEALYIINPFVDFMNESLLAKKDKKSFDAGVTLSLKIGNELIEKLKTIPEGSIHSINDIDKLYEEFEYEILENHLTDAQMSAYIKIADGEIDDEGNDDEND